MANNTKQNRHPGISIRRLLLHPAILFLFAAIVMIGGTVSLWNRYQDQIVNVAEFELNPNSIRVDPPAPAWATADLNSILLDKLKHSTLLDTGLVASAAESIRSVGWVENIERIQKSNSGLDISVTYRQPVAMVKTADGQSFPIDRLGVVFDPTLISENQAANLLTVSMFRPLGPNDRLQLWQKWPDQRIESAAAIGAAVGAYGKPLGLYRIVTWQLPGDRAEPKPFELWTFGHKNSIDHNHYASKVMWGSPLGKEAADEAPAFAKIQAIDAYIRQNGPLAESIPSGKILDVRSGKPVLISHARSAENGIFSPDLR